MESRPTVFLHYFNPEILRVFGYEPLRDSKVLVPASVRLTRWALAISLHPLLVPVSALFECPYFREIARVFETAIRGNFLNFISPTPEIGEYVKKKQYEFQGHRGRYPVYYSGDLKQIAGVISKSAWRPRLIRSASAEIGRVWQSAFLGDTPFWSRILSEDSSFRSSRASFSQIEKTIREIPGRLNKRAFVLEEVEPLLPRNLDAKSKRRIGFLINQGYLESYLNEYGAVFFSDTELSAGELFLTPPADERRYSLSLRGLIEDFRFLKLDSSIQEQLSVEDLLAVTQMYEFRVLVDEILQNQVTPNAGKVTGLGLSVATVTSPSFGPRSPSRLDSVVDHIKRVHDSLEKVRTPFFTQASIQQPRQNMNKKANSIFLVHNTKSPAITEITKLLKSASVSLIHWEDAVAATGKPSPQILEVIRKGFDIATAVLILMTPDERAEVIDRKVTRKRGTKIVRPRPNVLIEVGMALGMDADRTVIVSTGRLGQISDLDGIHIVHLDGLKDSRVALMNRLKQAGCEPSLTDLDYLKLKLPQIQALARE